MSIDTSLETIEGIYHMSLFTPSQYETLCKNWSDDNHDHIPVAYLTYPKLGYQWLISEIDPSEPNTAYGLSYLNDGTPTLGPIDLNFVQQFDSEENKIFNSPAFHTQDKITLFKAVGDELGYIVTREEGNSELFAKLRRTI